MQGADIIGVFVFRRYSWRLGCRIFLLFSDNVGLSYATTTTIMENYRSEKWFTPLICVHLR